MFFQTARGSTNGKQIPRVCAREKTRAALIARNIRRRRNVRVVELERVSHFAISPFLLLIRPGTGLFKRARERP